LAGTIPANGYFLLVHVTTSLATTTPTPGGCVVFDRTHLGGVPIQLFSFTINVSNDTLTLYNPSDVPVDYANRFGSKWPAGASKKHASMERRGVVRDADSAWITYADPNGFAAVLDCDGHRVFGTPGHVNWSNGLRQTPSPTPRPYKSPTPRPPTPFAHLVINEFLPRAGFDWNEDGTVDVYDEFIEVENLGPVSVDLKGWKLDDEANLGSTPYTLPSTKLNSGQRAVFYGSVTGILLDDSGDTVRLINTRGIIVDSRTYGVIKYADQTHCRLPDGAGYWTYPCFPTPGLENERTGAVPALPPNEVVSKPPPCLLPDTVPDVFREPVCHPFGADIWNRSYWDDQAGQLKIPVQDIYDKWHTFVE
jgi:hypothetical protein